MSDRGERGLLDRLVELAARVLDALGLNGARLRWRWNRRRELLDERRADAETYLRSARGKYKMCRSCRALVAKNVRQCPECGTDLGGVTSPGLGRVLGQLFPGAAAVTSLLLLVNGFFFALMLMAQVKSGEGVGLLPSFGVLVLRRFGQGVGLLTFDYGWRLITPVFLHAGLIHFAFNSWALLNLGPLVENEYGRERYWVIYLGCGVAGNVLASVFNQGVVGASGAIFGLVGLLIVAGARSGTARGRQMKAFLLRWSVFLFVFSLLPGISLAAHAGGFLAGLAAGWVVPAGPLRSGTAQRVWGLAALACVLVVLWAFWEVAREAGWS